MMNDKNIKPGTLTEGTTSLFTPDIGQIQAQIKDMQLEINLLKGTINVLKKDPGIDQTALKNREKAVIVDALKHRYSLPILLKLLNFPRSGYYYQKAVFRQKDKYDNICKKIVALFNENKRCYGYRRIHGSLKREGITVSEKIVRRIMQEEDLVIKTRKRKNYNSYQGEISPSVSNLIQRDFHANKPNEKWLTDITEFAIPIGKIYLSSIVDCFDGMLPC